MNLYSLDVETDNSSGFGLDPRKAAITSVAVAYDGGAWFCEVGGLSEGALLHSLNAFLGDLDAGVIVTWNGSNFDLPYIARRCSAWELDAPTLMPADDRPPKYPRGPDDYRLLDDHDGGYLAQWGHHDHADICYPYEADAKAAGVKWSLKPVAQQHGLRPVELDATKLHEATPAERMAYNLSDAQVTLALARRLPSLPLDSDAA